MEMGSSIPNLRETASTSCMMFLNNGSNSGIARHLDQRGAGECADRIEGRVAQKLYENLVPDASGNRAPKAGGDEGLRNCPDAIGA